MTSVSSNYTKARFSKDDSALLLIDHQSGTMQLNLTPAWEFLAAVIALAKVGKIFKLPTILTSNYETGPNGSIIQELLDLHPEVMVASELQRDWRLPTAQAMAQVFHEHNPNYSMLMGSFQARTPQAAAK